MLATLRVRNLVLIDELELHLGPGLNVLTGETGAGKSILVDALSLLLGGRASAELIRSGSTEGEVEALFDQYEAAGSDLEKGALAAQICLALKVVMDCTASGNGPTT